MRSTRSIAKRHCRSASTISRKLKRTSGSGGGGGYDALGRVTGINAGFSGRN